MNISDTVPETVHQSRKARWIATVLVAVLSAGVLLGDSTKEDLLAALGGSMILIAAAWSTPKQWPLVRTGATTTAGTCLAFAGIVGLDSPDATASWLVGAVKWPARDAIGSTP